MISKFYKIVIVGQGATGTVSILRRYLEGKFSPDYRPGHGAQFWLADIKETIRGESIRISAWPRPRYTSAPDDRQWAGLFRGINGLILVYDITRRRSLVELPILLDIALTHSSSFPVAIVGNKIDLVGKNREERRQYWAYEDTIDPSNGLQLAENISNEYDIPTLFMETSAKTGENIHRLFTEFLGMIVDLEAKRESKKDFDMDAPEDKPEDIYTRFERILEKGRKRDNLIKAINMKLEQDSTQVEDE